MQLGRHHRRSLDALEVKIFGLDLKVTKKKISFVLSVYPFILFFGYVCFRVFIWLDYKGSLVCAMYKEYLIDV